MPSCLRLLVQDMRLAASRTRCTADRSRPTRTPMMAITTNSSISVKAPRCRACGVGWISIGRLLRFGPVDAKGGPFVALPRQHDEQAATVRVEQAGAGQRPGWNLLGDGEAAAVAALQHRQEALAADGV